MPQIPPHDNHGRLHQALGDLSPLGPDEFWAQITGWDGTIWYSWVEVNEYPTRYFTRAPGGKFGNFRPFLWPAREINNAGVQIGSYVRMRFGDFDVNSSWTMLFDAGTASELLQPCTTTEYDIQTKDQCDYPILNRYTRTLVFLCGVLQFPLPAWQNTGQVGCCDCDVSGTGTGSGAPSCCCPPNPLCIAWPFATDINMINGLTLQPLFDQGTPEFCQWKYSGKLAGTAVTVTATWYGCQVVSGDVGQLVIDVVCSGNLLWATYVAEIPTNGQGCWNMLNVEIALWTGGKSSCPLLGATPTFCHVVEGPAPCRFDSGTGTGTGYNCPQPLTLCAYIPPGIYGGCNCVNGAAVTLAYQGGVSYAGTLILLNCPDMPAIFVYVNYYNDGTNWRVQIQATGCGQDTGVQTFYGLSLGNCLAGLPQCVFVTSPNTCCGAGSGLGGCQECTGLTPGTISFVGSGFLSDMAVINGSWTLTNPSFTGGQCNWQIDETAGAPTISVTLSGGVWTLQLTNNTTGNVAVYEQTGFIGDCCSPLVLDLDFASEPADCPATVTLTPNCSSSPVDPGALGGGTIPGPVSGDGFTICVTNGPCNPSGTGTGSGISQWWCVLLTGGSGVVSPCCPGDELPTTVVATLTLSTSGVTVADLVWDGSTYWKWTGTLLCGDIISLRLSCTGSSSTSFTLEYLKSGGVLWTPFATPGLTGTCVPFSVSGWTPVTLTTGGGFPNCNGQTLSVSVAGSSSSGTGTGTGSGPPVYECVPQSSLFGTIAVGGSVTWGTNAGVIDTGPYETPVCDNQCPPTTGTGVIPPPCCGWSKGGVYPQILAVTYGAGLIQLASFELIAQPELYLWSGSGLQAPCGRNFTDLLCDGASGVFTLNGGLFDPVTGVEYAQWSATGFPDSCNPLLINFSGKTVRVGPGGTATPGCGLDSDGGGVEWVATVTLLQ